MAALEGVDGLLILTEWRAFRSPDFERMRSLMKTPLVIDGRNLFDPDDATAAGLDYVPIGRASERHGDDGAAHHHDRPHGHDAVWAKAA